MSESQVIDVRNCFSETMYGLPPIHPSQIHIALLSEDEAEEQQIKGSHSVSAAESAVQVLAEPSLPSVSRPLTQIIRNPTSSHSSDTHLTQSELNRNSVASAPPDITYCKNVPSNSFSERTYGQFSMPEPLARNAGGKCVRSRYQIHPGVYRPYSKQNRKNVRVSQTDYDVEKLIHAKMKEVSLNRG